MALRTPDQALADVTRAVGRLTAASRGLLTWEWDSRFSAALGIVKAPHHLPILELLGQLFPRAWDDRTLRQAPEAVRLVAAAWGGMQAGQRLLVIEPADDPLFFAAWWPWGSGTTFSLRISCAARSAAAKDCEPLTQLRRCFAL